MTWANFQKDGKTFSDKDLLNNIVSGLTIVEIVDFNILWLIQSGPMALFTGSTEIISKTSCSRYRNFPKIYTGYRE